MIRELGTEFFKVKRRFLWLLPLGVVLVEFLWIYTNDYLRQSEILAEGYNTLLLHLPIMNIIFLPLVLSAIASRICDAENKGNTYKLLCTMQQKGRIFDIKLIMGALYVFMFTLLEALNLLLLARLIHVTQALPIKHVLIFLGVCFIVSLVIYLFHLILSLLLTSQLIPLFVGLLGSLVGLFSAFFPIGILAGLTPWGYYLVGMTFASRYDAGTRTSVIYEIPFPTVWFLFYLSAACILYVVGKSLFLRKEV